MQKKALADVIKLRVERRKKEVEVKNLAKSLSVILKKSREKQRPDVTCKRIKYFMRKPQAKALHNLQPGEIVGLKVRDKWVQFNLLKGERLSYKESSLLWKTISKCGKVVTRCMTPVNEWRVLRGVDRLLDLGELVARVPSSRQQGCMLRADCNVCNDSAIGLVTEEVQHLVKTLPFPCPHAGHIILFRLDHAGEGAVFPNPRPGCPVLSDKKGKANGTVVSAVKTRKFQQRSNSLKVGAQRLTAINKKLRAAVSRCEDRMIKGYPDLEFAIIDKFIGALVESTGTLGVNVDMAVESFCRIAEVKERYGLDPKIEELARPQEAHNTRRPPEISGEDETRSNSLPPPSSRTQEPAGTEDSASGGFLQGAGGGVWTGSGGEPPNNSQYSSTYAEEIRWRERAKQKRPQMQVPPQPRISSLAGPVQGNPADLWTSGPTRTSETGSHFKRQDGPSSLILPPRGAAFNRKKRTKASTAKPVAVGGPASELEGT